MEFRGATVNLSQRDFWGMYVEMMIKQGVKQQYVRWYAVRWEDFLKAVGEENLQGDSTKIVKGYLEELGRNTRLKDWQIQQAVDAIQNFMFVIDDSCFSKVDLNFWKKAAISLPSSHDTIARDEVVVRQKDGIKRKDSAYDIVYRSYGD